MQGLLAIFKEYFKKYFKVGHFSFSIPEFKFVIPQIQYFLIFLP